MVKDNIWIVDDYNENYGGLCVSSSYSINPMILLYESENPLSIYVGLVHEFGHAYEGILCQTENRISTLSLNLCLEITSILFEKIFLSLINDNSSFGKIKENVLIERMKLKRYVCLCQDIITLFSDSNNTEVMGYNGEFYIRDFNEYLTDYNKELLKKIKYYRSPLFYKYSYLIGEVVANNFMSQYKGDLRGLLKEFNNFVIGLPYIDIKEVIRDYGKIDATKMKVKKLSRNM